jgi:hypothetical protein
VIVLAAGAALVLMGGAAPAPDAGQSPRGLATAPVARPGVLPHLIGTVARDSIAARTAPDADAEVIARFDAVNDQGAPQVFLLEPEQRAPDGGLPPGIEWVRALLPVRPNGTRGYLPVDGLELSVTTYRVEVDTRAFELTLFDGDDVVFTAPVGIGKGKTPTPKGKFYLASLLKPPDPDTVYGTYAYGLSGYSETLKDWKDGGIVGIHGTNDPSSIGRRVSHGCIRLHNRDIERLVELLPLGTPVLIR